MALGDDTRLYRRRSRRWPAPLAASGAATATAVHTAFVARAAAGDLAAARFPPPGPESLASMFRSPRPSSLSLPDYLTQVLSGVGCSPASLVLSVLLLDRAADAPPAAALRMESASACLLALTAVVLASKVHDDVYYSNSFYASVGGVSTSELKQLELAFLASVRFRLHVTPEQYMTMETELLVAVAANPAVAALAAAHGYATGLRARLTPQPLAVLDEVAANVGAMGEYVCQSACGGCSDCSDLKFSTVPPVQLLQAYLVGELMPPPPPNVDCQSSYEHHSGGLRMTLPRSAPTPSAPKHSVPLDVWAAGGGGGLTKSVSAMDGSNGGYGGTAPYSSYSSFVSVASTAYRQPGMAASSGSIGGAIGSSGCGGVGRSGVSGGGAGWGRTPYGLAVGSYAEIEPSRGPERGRPLPSYGAVYGGEAGSGIDDGGSRQRCTMEVADLPRSADGSRLSYPHSGVHMLLSSNEYDHKRRYRVEQEQWQQQQRMEHNRHVHQMHVEDSAMRNYEQHVQLHQQPELQWLREHQTISERRPLERDVHSPRSMYRCAPSSMSRVAGTVEVDARLDSVTHARLLADQHQMFCGRDGPVADDLRAPLAPRARPKPGGDAAWFSRYGAEEPLFSGGTGGPPGPVVTGIPPSAPASHGRGGWDGAAGWGAAGERQPARTASGDGDGRGGSTLNMPPERLMDRWSYRLELSGDGFGYPSGPVAPPPLRSVSTF
ncbi:hypothetical protein MMPV_004529 [Pyropia vietnamensis]